MTLSQVLAQTRLSGQHKQVQDQTIEVDQYVYHLNYALSFYDCTFQIPPTSDLQSFTIFTDQCIRFENCTMKIGVCVWGQDGAAGFEVLDRKGPNIFFDNCKWSSFSITIAGNMNVDCTPAIQISGYADHFRSTPNDGSKVQLTISQCRFQRVEIVGTYQQIQMVEYIGNELTLGNVNTSFLWIRERMLPNIRYIEIDEISAENISSLFLSKQHELTPHDLNVVKNFMEVFSAKKEGQKFLMMNAAYCKNAPNPTFSSYLTLVLFKNFYSITPWFVLAGVTILIFIFAFLPFEMDLFKSTLTSLYSISGNPSLNLGENSFFSLLKSLESFMGIFFVIMISWILGRKYSNYI